MRGQAEGPWTLRSGPSFSPNVAKQSRHGSKIQEMTCSVWLEFEACGGAVMRAEAGGQIKVCGAKGLNSEPSHPDRD